MVEEEVAAVVADNGSGICNTEFAGDDTSRVELPSIIDMPKMTHLCSISRRCFLLHHIQAVTEQFLPTESMTKLRVVLGLCAGAAADHS